MENNELFFIHKNVRIYNVRIYIEWIKKWKIIKLMLILTKEEL